MKTARPNRGKTQTSTALILLSALILSAITAACWGMVTSPGTTTPPGAPATASPTASAKDSPPPGLSTVPPVVNFNPRADGSNHPGQAMHQDLDMCQDGDSDGHRRNDLAKHVYDGAVARYLLKNASGIGREITPESSAYALMLLSDDESYELCIEIPERCLRIQFLRAGSQEERDALLAGAASYAYDRALACLQRAGDAYAAQRSTAETGALDLEALYQKRVLPRLIGNMMPVAMLTDSTFFGTDNEDAHRVATDVWQDCFNALSGEPVDSERLAERVSDDMTAVTDCVEELHEKIPEWTERPTTGGDPAPESTTTPTRTPVPHAEPTLTATPPPPATTTEPAPTPDPSESPDAEPGNDWTRAIARNRSGGKVFSLMLPPGWRLVTEQGIDSYVGDIRGDGVLMRFDFGWYSHEPKPKRYPQHEYLVLHQDIGGHRAKLVLAADPPEESRENYMAVTAVYFDDLYRGNRFLMAGEGLTETQQQTAVAIFRSIQMNHPAQETGQTKPNNEHPAVVAARKAASLHLTDLSPGNEQRLVLVLQEAIQWPSAALGCSKEGMVYAQVVVPGYRITLAHEGRTITVHTNEEGRRAIVPQGCLENQQAANPSPANQQPADTGRIIHVTLAPAGAPCPVDNARHDQVPPIQGGQEYQLCLNGQRVGTFLGSYQEPDPSLVPTRLVESTVLDVFTEALEQYPAFYRLRVRSARPSGNCTGPAGYEVRRIGLETLNVRILHHQTKAPGARCTKDMVNDWTTVPLGTDFQEGREYTLQVNGWNGSLIP